MKIQENIKTNLDKLLEDFHKFKEDKEYIERFKINSDFLKLILDNKCIYDQKLLKDIDYYIQDYAYCKYECTNIKLTVKEIETYVDFLNKKSTYNGNNEILSALFNALQYDSLILRVDTIEEMNNLKKIFLDSIINKELRSEELIVMRFFINNKQDNLIHKLREKICDVNLDALEKDFNKIWEERYECVHFDLEKRYFKIYGIDIMIKLLILKNYF